MSRSIRPLSIAAVVAQIVFIVAWLIAPLWQGPRYSVVAHSISDMYAVTAPAGIVLVVVFTITGAITILFALVSVRLTFRGAGWTAVLGSILLALSVFGLGDLLSPFERLACRIADPGCTPAGQVANAGGLLDNILTTAGFAIFIAAAIFLSFAFAATTGWRTWTWPARVVAIAIIAVFTADGVLAATGLGGILERALAAIGALAIAALAVALSRRQAPDQ